MNKQEALSKLQDINTYNLSQIEEDETAAIQLNKMWYDKVVVKIEEAQGNYESVLNQPVSKTREPCRGCGS